MNNRRFLSGYTRWRSTQNLNAKFSFFVFHSVYSAILGSQFYKKKREKKKYSIDRTIKSTSLYIQDQKRREREKKERIIIMMMDI